MFAPVSRPNRQARPEPNFSSFFLPEQLRETDITAHAIVRYVERLQPGIPGADEIARTASRLEKARSRTPGQRQELGRCHAWLHEHVRSSIEELIVIEGFWATGRPHWCRSRTHSDGHLQVGGLCYFPMALDNGRAVLTTCETTRDVTWDTALQRGYTLIPKPLFYSRRKLWPRPFSKVLRRAWRSRRERGGLITALAAEKAKASEDLRLARERQNDEIQQAQEQWRTQRDRAFRTFRERHPQSA